MSRLNRVLALVADRAFDHRTVVGHELLGQRAPGTRVHVGVVELGQSLRSNHSPTTKSLGAMGALICAVKVCIQSGFCFDLHAVEAPDHVRPPRAIVVVPAHGVAELAVVDEVDAGLFLLRTASTTALLSSRSKAASSTFSPVARWWLSSITFAGRGRLPTCVVRIRSAMFSSLEIATSFAPCARAAAARHPLRCDQTYQAARCSQRRPARGEMGQRPPSFAHLCGKCDCELRVQAGT